MNSFTFDYSRFYNFYTDRQNLILDPITTDVYYFLDIPRPTVSTPEKTINSDYYMTISGNKIYVSQIVNGDILFTIPNLINGFVYADHYHFGLDMRNDKSVLNTSVGTVPTVFFHKTIQLPQPLSKTGGKDTVHCWFRNGTIIVDVKDIICTQQKTGKMNKKFPFPQTFTTDFEFLQEILTRPFLGIQNQGGGNKTVKELREFAKLRNITGYSKMNKHNLIKLLF
jgi:hypothetical protein